MTVQSLLHLPATDVDLDEIAASFAAIALKAGAVVMRVYHEDFAVRCKADFSPVCEADVRAEAIILAELRQIAPKIPIVAEEAASCGDIPLCGRRFILVDPLDGTREFVGRNGEFTVNIALVSDGIPCCGAVYAPVLHKLWFGASRAFGCQAEPGGELPSRTTWRELRTSLPPADGMVALASRSHGDAATEAFLAKLAVRERRSFGSSLKFCAIAEAQADVYPRFGPTMEWDTAAGDAVLRAAGGVVVTCDGAPLLYGKAGKAYKNPAFVAWGDREAAAKRTAACA